MLEYLLHQSGTKQRFPARELDLEFAARLCKKRDGSLCGFKRHVRFGNAVVCGVTIPAGEITAVGQAQNQELCFFHRSISPSVLCSRFFHCATAPSDTISTLPP